MRFIVLGVGAVGGTVAAALTFAGQEVIGIARGEHLQAIQANGLVLRTPSAVRTAQFACVASPLEIEPRPDDVILLAIKTQDTEYALAQLKAAGFSDQPIFCLQNGVENERLALRHFPNVHGVTVLMIAEFLTVGEVAAFGEPNHGIFDIGRYPSGADAADTAVADVLTAAGIASFVSQDIMQRKYGKLHLNLGNIVETALDDDVRTAEINAIVRDEGQAVLAAAGIVWQDVGAQDPRRDALMQPQEIAGMQRSGSSSAQSLARGAGSIETDYLNGEIVLLGRIHNVPTPANAWFTDLAARLVRDGAAPCTVSRAEIEAALGL